MDQNLAYLRESLSNYTNEQDAAQQVYKKLLKGNFKDEREFARSLEENEVEFLNKILPDEIRYAMEEKDYERMEQLNGVYQYLF